MGFDGVPPAPKPAGTLSPKTQEVLDDLERLQRGGKDANYQVTTHALTGLLHTLYEPALAVAAAINSVRQGNLSAAPFIGAAGVILSQALAPLVEHFNDGETSFEDVMERIGIPVVSFADLPDVPIVQTDAPEEPEE